MGRSSLAVQAERKKGLSTTEARWSLPVMPKPNYRFLFCRPPRNEFSRVWFAWEEPGWMLKVSEYQDRAVECRKMAASMRDLTKKARFEEIARAWQMLADTRMKQLERRLRSRAEFRQRKCLEIRA